MELDDEEILTFYSEGKPVVQLTKPMAVKCK
jgi:hypothetical protein